MKAISISYTNFRNVESETLTLGEGVNVIHGNNAQGKSNMLEGLYFFARGRSFRGAKEKELIRFGEKNCSLELTYTCEKHKLPTTLGAEIPSQGKKILYRNGARLTGIKEMMGNFRAVLFCPAHLALVDGGPAMRRSFLDIALGQLYPAYIDSLSDYNRTLAQRAVLLKEAQTKTVDPYLWEVYAKRLASEGARLAARRWAYTTELSEAVAEIFCAMTDGREIPSLTYKCDFISDGMGPDEIISEGESRLYEMIMGSLEKDIRYGATTYGVHRDDIAVKLNQKDAKLFASQGQKRSIALAMKLSEGDISKKLTGEYPVFLLDDVLSELDSSRRAFIMSRLSGRQIIVTSCEDELFDGDGVNFIHVKGGRIADEAVQDN